MAAFAWLDRHPSCHWAVAWGCFLLCLASAWLARPETAAARWRHWLTRPAVFALLLGLTLAAFRWPSWFVTAEFNPDESQMLAGAITLREFPVFWKHVDGTTHGPLNDFALNAAAFAGLPLDFLGARATAAVLLAATLLCLWQCLRRLVSEQTARLGVLPGLAFWSFSWVGDYLHYSSELIAILLLTGAAWGLAAVFTGNRPGAPAALVTGLLLALVPLAKLQAAPLALAAGLIALAGLAWSKPARWTVLAGGMAGGALLVLLVLWGFLALYGLQAQFWLSYVTSNLTYAGARDHLLAEMPNHFWDFMPTGQSFAWFFFGCIAFVLWRAQAAWVAAPVHLRRALAAAWGAALLAYVCVLLPGRQVAHYLHLLVGPLVLLAGLHLADGPAAPGRNRFALLAVFAGLALLPQALNRLQVGQPAPGRVSEYLAGSVSPAGAFIRQRREPGQSLTVWGWHPRLHVETQLPQGTREAHSAFQIFDGPMQSFYRSRYLRDLNSRKPEWFVDATGPGSFVFDDPGRHGYEHFPELRDLIGSQYELQATFGITRIYRRKSVDR